MAQSNQIVCLVCNRCPTECICLRPRRGFRTVDTGRTIILFDKPSEDTNLEEFTIKDSGERQQFESGMVRDITTGKTEYHRVADGPMLRRWAVHLTKGGVKYPDIAPGIANWTLANGSPEFMRFRQSAFRHFMQWYCGERDEDHAAAVFFNINGAEYVRGDEKYAG